MAKVTITLANGTKVECEPGDVASVVDSYSKRVGQPMYFSESRHTLIPISTMNAVHIRNAITSRHSHWVDSISPAMTPVAWVDTFLTGPVDDPVIANLLAALKTKYSWKS